MTDIQLKKIDFSDSFRITNHEQSIEEIAKNIFGSGPKWVVGLFKLRNQIVKPFGLKVPDAPDLSKPLTVGSCIGLFEVFDISDEHMMLGADDSHLNFRVLLKNGPSATKNIELTTSVEINNWIGRIYFFFVRPIHPIVVKALLKRLDKTVS